jgi:hypothetical protein
MDSTIRPRRRRGWKMALAFLIVVALPSFWFLAGYRTRRTVERVRALNGMATSTSWIPLPIPGGRLEYGPLDDVYFLGPKTDDDGLEVLNEVPDLRRLTLTNTRVTDEGLARLARFRRLNCLYIGNIDHKKLIRPAFARLDTDPLITGKGLASLKDLPNLEVVQLIGPSTTDEDLPSLKGLKHLILLDLKGTKVTDAGVADLRKALPNCKINVR